MRYPNVAKKEHMMTINTLYELVRNSVEKFASKVAFSMYEGDDVTYAEVGRRIARVQEILTGAGLRAEIGREHV